MAWTRRTFLRCAVAALWLACAPAAWTATLRVATTGNDSTGDGSALTPYATPGKAGSVHAAGDTILVATGAYSITSTTANVAGGRISLTAGASSNALTRLIGTDASFNSLSGAAPVQSNNPVLTASGIATTTIVTMGTNCSVENISVNGASLTAIGGFTTASAANRYWNCRATSCPGGGFVGANGGTYLDFCYASACPNGFLRGTVTGCVATLNTSAGYLNVNNAFWSIAAGNTGSTTDGFVTNAATSLVIGCSSYNNGEHGFNLNAGVGQVINCYAEGQVAIGACGFTATAADDGMYLLNCAGFNNTSNVGANIPAANRINFKTLSFSGLISPGTSAGSNFTPNTTASAGALLRAAGLMSAGFPFYTGTTSYGSIGAVDPHSFLLQESR